MFGKNHLRKALNKLSTAREVHKERHRPTGFGFAIADRLDYLNPEHWDAVTGDRSFFLSRPYLHTLVAHGPETIDPRFALVFRDQKPVAAISMQLLKVSADRLMKGKASTVALERKRDKFKQAMLPVAQKVGANLRERVLICGNLLSWGCHGVAFAPGEDPAELWPAVAEALNRVRRTERLAGPSDFSVIKDITAAHARGVDALDRHSFRRVETDPNMVLEFRPDWKGYPDYLAALDSKNRKSALQNVKKLEAAGCTVELLKDPTPHMERLHELYMAVQGNNTMRLFSITPEFIPALARACGDTFRCTVIRQGEKILGFVTTVKDGDTAIGWYVGFDREAAAELPLYLRLLHAVVGDSLALGCKRLSLGRTALEPKARLGAKPEPMSVWIRHRVPVLNAALRRILDAIPHAEAPERNPFKQENPTPQAE